MKIILKESQYVHLLENLNKNKKFLNDIMGVDFTDKIKMITSTYDVPMEFDEVIGPEYIRRVLNYFGPMYLIDIDGKKYLYQHRTDKEDGDFEWFHDEHGFNYVDGEILEKLGIDEIGLRFSNIIDMYFNEEESLNENVDKNKKFLNDIMGEDFTGKIKKVKSLYDIPYSFYRKGIFTMPDVAAYLTKFGPMYLFEMEEIDYIYQDRGKYEFFYDENGNYYKDDEIPIVSGIYDIGLRFSNIIDIYFNKEEI
jgi:hypothetical protein